jgi:hypothetical protein
MVVVRVSLPNGPSGELSSAMHNMRLWLDSRRFEPSSFQMRLSGRNRVGLLRFKSRAEAEAFAVEFEGTVISAIRPSI